MTQNVVDFSGNPTGSGLMDDYLDKDQQNVLTSNSGIQRPSYAVAGTKWLDTSANPWVWKMYDGTNDVSLGTVNPSTHLFTPAGVLPSQGGNSGKFLQTDGSKTVWTNAVDYTNITNCITEIPQDIKLELVDGVLTLKAGSKVYVPNGKNADGSNRFDVVTLQNDIQKTDYSPTVEQVFLFIDINTGYIYASNLNGCGSGTSSTVGVVNGLYYNTQNNTIYPRNDSSTVKQSFPIAIVTNSGVSTTASIDQVFNGFGYISSTVFALPGVKGLIPNGRNTDGSLKNIEFVTNNVKINSRTVSASAQFSLYLSNKDYGNTKDITYDAETNFNKWNNKSGVLLSAHVGEVLFSSSGITSLTPKTAFHAVDYSDYAREIDSKADDSAVVHKAGNEEIFDIKTFSQGDIRGRTSTSSYSGLARYACFDKDGVQYSDAWITRSEGGNSNGLSWAGFRISDSKGIITAGRSLAIYKLPDSDTIKTYAPTPPASDNNTQIATTAWVNTRISNVMDNSAIGYPNYSAGVSFASGWTASANGWIILQTSAGGGFQEATISINNVSIMAPVNLDGSKWDGILPVKKGDVISFTLITLATFYPLR